METGSSLSSSDPSRQKRSRALLSCGPCRFSKLKCDREAPCGQCLKRERPDQCQYAPRPEKRKPSKKNMGARLKRLEGMVRGMMDANGDSVSQQPKQKQPEQRNERPQVMEVKGQVVRGQVPTTYVGATHCMAMLEDIEDLKCYFEEAEDTASTPNGLDASELLIFSRGAPKTRDDLLAELPERKVADRLITRYFASMSPSQHIIHRGTFAKTYAQFWQEPDAVTTHWIAQLFMMLALGIHYSNFQAPHEIKADSPIPAHDRIKHYKSCAGWALAWDRYTQPNATTLPAFLLYVESYFLFNRASQMDCYILSGVLIRLMLKMGLHRDPRKLPNITPFEGEMRRRMWNMAIQVESLVAFHMGLPCMFPSIEADTDVPRNLKDDDFDESCTELPPGRPASDWTNMSYPIHKTGLVRVFGQIARQAHALTPPSYIEVSRLDSLLQENWNTLPSILHVKPLGECVSDPHTLLIQRFGLEALYNKCRCVLHRRYLAKPIAQKEHDYSRKQCLQGAMTLLKNQNIIWEASKPGNVLSDMGWFISSLAVHDYLLAAMVLYLVVQNKDELDWAEPATSKEELRGMIQRSYEIWSLVADSATELRKTADTLAVMLTKLGCFVDRPMNKTPSVPQTVESSSSVMPQSSIGNIGKDIYSISSFGPDSMTRHPSLGSATGQTPFPMTQNTEAINTMGFADFPMTGETIPKTLDLNSPWILPGNNMDWRYLDVSLAHSHTGGSNVDDPGPLWTEQPPLDDMEVVVTDFWSQSSG